eukprot:242934-Karenia_brevis.AAC.1
MANSDQLLQQIVSNMVSKGDLDSLKTEIQQTVQQQSKHPWTKYAQNMIESLRRLIRLLVSFVLWSRL